MRSSLTMGLCSAGGGMEIRAVPRVFKSQSASCHGGRNKQHIFSLLPQWAALRPLLLSHPSLGGVGHNCRLAFCGRHGSELRDMVQPVRHHSIIGLRGWSRAIRNTCRERELTAEGHCALNSKWAVEDQGNRLPVSSQVLFPKLSLLAWKSTVVVLATNFHDHAGRICTFVGTNDWGNVGPLRLPARGLGITVRERLFGVTTAMRVAHGCATPALEPPHDNPGPHIRGSARPSLHQVRGCGTVRLDLSTPACRLSPNLARLCVLTSQKR